MVIFLVCLVCAFALAAVCLLLKVVALKISLREISGRAEEKFRESSNAPLAPQSRDADVKRLCDVLEREISEVNEARRQCAAANGEFTRAVTNVSHDLRTPLTSVSGYLGLLAKSGLEGRQAEYLRIVQGRVDAMKKLTEELLAYSVSACEDAAAEPQEVCVNDVLEDSLTQFYAAFCERGIEPKINICGERVLRFFDKQALPRIFGNIISNAVRYSDGDFSVTMRVDGVIEFENAASALDEVSAAKLFDRYFTVENGKLSTGLGLSIARTLLEKAGGEISAEWHRGRLKITLRL